uniref:Uncharacterized protein n=1 Tax=viral metagenome TaxID=1070528 RepID=A0A6H2A266_9ZZZZ
MSFKIGDKVASIWEPKEEGIVRHKIRDWIAVSKKHFMHWEKQKECCLVGSEKHQKALTLRGQLIELDVQVEKVEKELEALEKG